MVESIRACETMTEVRREIDRIDRAIVHLIAERAGYIAEAARIKVRESLIRDVIANVRAEAARAGLEPNIAEAIWRPMVETFIRHEMELFRRKGQPRVDRCAPRRGRCRAGRISG
jgi:isochorismate pyruvate lyase